MAIYNGKHVVFEQVGVDSNSIQWNPSSNQDSDNAYNDWNISDMRNTHLPTRLLLLSSALQDNLTTTTIQTAKNGINGTLVSTSDKLFLVAEKEIKGTRTYSRTEEFNALTTWSYYTIHTQVSDRIKKDPSNTAQMYWMRSAVSDRIDTVEVIDENGGSNSRQATFARWVSLCYAF